MTEYQAICTQCGVIFKTPIEVKDNYRIICPPCQRRQIMYIMNVPKMYRRCLFANYNHAFNDNLRTVDKIIQLANQRKWIFLSGPVGVGKTHLAVAAMFQSYLSYPQGNTPYRKSIPIEERHTFIQMRSWGNKLAMAGIEMDTLVKNTTGRMVCLLLDDLGREPEKAVDRVCMLIDDFYAAKKQIIATTNLTPKELASTYGDAIVDRIVESGLVLNLKGKSYRKRNKK